MELNQLRCFIAVADELHFGHAAQKLDMLPSTLGRYVRLLEETLGIRLLARSTRNVSLTPHGQLFLDEARDIVGGADQPGSTLSKVRPTAGRKATDRHHRQHSRQPDTADPARLS